MILQLAMAMCSSAIEPLKFGGIQFLFKSQSQIVANLVWIERPCCLHTISISKLLAMCVLYHGGVGCGWESDMLDTKLFRYASKPIVLSYTKECELCKMECTVAITYSTNA